MAELKAKDLKLVQYLNEAYGKERQLETALQAHIAIAEGTKGAQSYVKRLRDHLKETQRHAREVGKRIKQLGGTAETVDLPGPPVATAVAEATVGLAQRAAAAAAGPLHALRGTGAQEKLLKNAKTEYQDEFEEIATYFAIETFADEVGDTETRNLARSIRKEEERMARFLEKLIPRLAKAVAKEEVPAADRKGGRRRSSSRSRKSAPSRKSGARKSTARKSTARKSTARKSTARKSTARKSTARKSTARKSTARKSTARKSTARKSTARKSTARKSTARKTTRKSTPRKSTSRSRKTTASRS